MKTRDLLVALDQGTSSTRAIVYDAKTLVAEFTSRRELPQYYPHPGWVEHDAEQIWQACKDVIDEAHDYASTSGGRLAALGITNQRETVLLWERDGGRILHRAIVWQDRRTASRCAQLTEDGAAEIVRNKTGLVLDPYFSATKIAWLLEKTASYERAANGEVLAGTIDSFLLWRLTKGKIHATDVTNASRTQLLNLAERDWDDELLRLHNVPRGCLPQVYSCTSDFGVTDLNGGTLPICGIAGDQQAAAIGQGCVHSRQAKSTYGTGCFVIVQGDADVLIPTGGLLGTIGYQIGDQVTYAVEGSIFIAGSVIQWLRDQLGLFADSAQTAQLARQASDTGEVMVVPAFTGLGAPLWNPDARAAIVGLTLDTDKAQIVRAALEAVAYSTHDLFTAFDANKLRPEIIKVDGGMVANDWFLQYLADIVDLKVIRPVDIETTARGAAFLAGLQIGNYASLDAIGELNKLDRAFSPAMESDRRTARLASWQRAVQATIVYAQRK